MLERDFQSKLRREILERFSDCMIIKNDSGYTQGVPDLLILLPGFWAMLEVKRSADAPHRPNQDYYVERLDAMSFARFIYPENKEEVLDELQQAYESRGFTLFSESE